MLPQALEALEAPGQWVVPQDPMDPTAALVFILEMTVLQSTEQQG